MHSPDRCAAALRIASPLGNKRTSRNPSLDNLPWESSGIDTFCTISLVRSCESASIHLPCGQGSHSLAHGPCAVIQGGASFPDHLYFCHLYSTVRLSLLKYFARRTYFTHIWPGKKMAGSSVQSIIVCPSSTRDDPAELHVEYGLEHLQLVHRIVLQATETPCDSSTVSPVVRPH